MITSPLIAASRLRHRGVRPVFTRRHDQITTWADLKLLCSGSGTVYKATLIGNRLYHPVRFSSKHHVLSTDLPSSGRALGRQTSRQNRNLHNSDLVKSSFERPNGYALAAGKSGNAVGIHHETMEERVRRGVETTASKSPSSTTQEVTTTGDVPPQAALSYNISLSDFQEALMTSQASNGAYWSHSLYKDPDGQQVKILYCKDVDRAERAAQWFVGERIVGLDLEWEPYASATSGIKENVSVIQLAVEDKIAVFHLALFAGSTADGLMPPTLRRLLEDRSVVKTGVNIANDFNKLTKFLNVQGQGIFELSHIYKVVKYSKRRPELVNKRLVKLADQVQYAFGLPLLKGPVRTSAWSQTLTPEQVHYAAADAYAGYRLYHALDDLRKAMDPTPPLPALYELGRPLVLGNGLEPPRPPRRFEQSGSKIAASDSSATTEDMSVDETGATAEETSDEASDELDESEESNCEAGGFKSGMSGSASASSDGRIAAADAWCQAYRSSRLGRGKTAATAASLRAYALWHQHSLPAEDVAAMLRDPPLKTSTVRGYIFQAVACDMTLPYQGHRLKEVALALPRVVLHRFMTLARRLDDI